MRGACALHPLRLLVFRGSRRLTKQRYPRPTRGDRGSGRALRAPFPLQIKAPFVRRNPLSLLPDIGMGLRQTNVPTAPIIPACAGMRLPKSTVSY